jgi:predicted lipid-binding transport protein (Tim44 family)
MSGGFGSRGSRTYSAPPSTATAPRTAAPIERSATPQSQQPGGGYFQQRPGMAGQSGGFFGRQGGLLGGFLGAGLFGMLLGAGLFGGFGGLGSMLGFVLQIALIALLARWAWGAWQRRQQGATAAAGTGTLNRGATGPDYGAGSRMPGGAPAGGFPGTRGRVRDEVGIGKDDLDEFQRVLETVQTAYGREDRATLAAVMTPEMAAYMSEELDRNAARGVVNRVTDPKLLQGDLAESWRERDVEYATVAMRFSIVDWKEERGTGRVVEGDAGAPTEATEVWTFVRPGRRGKWKLSAIQQG